MRALIQSPVVAAAFAALSVPAIGGGEPVPQAALAKAKAAIVAFGAKLKASLNAALAEKGVVGAVDACNLMAPQIERSVAVEHGLRVGRTALKVRNPANAPDAFEARVLASFAAQAKAGAPIDTLLHAEVVEADGKKTLRVMKAIALAEQPCGACHGNAIAPDVSARIHMLYPGDQATGFSPGELRGAFTVSKDLP